VRIGGFDTHAEQTDDNDPTLGSHAALLYHISSAMSAFQKDLREKGLEDRVLTMTMSEFGRRIESNGSFGTDHGTGGPVMLFGKHVNPGIYGTNPDLDNRNVELQFDYRQLCAGILHDWMGVDQSVITNDIFFKDFITGPNNLGGSYEPLDLINDTLTGHQDFLSAKFKIDGIHPNPATNYAQVNILINDFQHVRFELINLDGKIVQVLNRSLNPGKHSVTFNLDNLLAGMYFIKAKSNKLNDTKRLIIRK